MKRILMTVFMFGVASCAVDAALPASASSADEGTTQATSNALTSTAPDVVTHGIQCDFLCEPRAQCLEEGGFPGPPCAVFTGTVCCEL